MEGEKRYYISTPEEIIGFTGHVAKHCTCQEIVSYLIRYGFRSAESARETAKQCGFVDANIKYVILY